MEWTAQIVRNVKNDASTFCFILILVSFLLKKLDQVLAEGTQIHYFEN